MNALLSGSFFTRISIPDYQASCKLIEGEGSSATRIISVSFCTSNHKAYQIHYVISYYLQSHQSCHIISVIFYLYIPYRFSYIIYQPHQIMPHHIIYHMAFHIISRQSYQINLVISYQVNPIISYHIISYQTYRLYHINHTISCHITSYRIYHHIIIPYITLLQLPFLDRFRGN